MAVVRKKQDDKYLKVLRELVSATGGGNRQCFDCGQKGPTYVNMTIGSFVCTRCSGVLRGLTPPHRVKSISMATFTPEEIEFLKSHGNDSCAKTWLGLWDPKRSVHQDHRELMIDKYERKRYFLEPASPLKSLTNATNLKSSTTPVAASNCSSSATHSSLSNNSSHNNFNGSSTNINNNNNNNNNIYNNNTTVTSNNFSNGFGNNNLNGNGNISNLAHKQNSIDSSFQNITLTPPAPHRSHNNGVQKSASAISRPTQQQNGYAHSHPHQGGFATLLSSASSSARNGNDDAFITSNGYHHPGSSFNGNVLSGHNGFNNGGLLNGLNISGSSSTGANSDTSSSTSNGFGPDADFVADFNSANIFDATSTAAGSSPAVVVPSKASIGGSSSLSTNGYAKIQAIAAAQLMNGNPPLIMNGNGNTVGHHNHQNGVGGLSTTAAALNHNGNAENFADFEHAPIFVAAENYQFVRKKVVKKKPAYVSEQEQESEPPLVIDFFAENQLNTKNSNISKPSADVVFSEVGTSNFIKSQLNPFTDLFDDKKPLRPTGRTNSSTNKYCNIFDTCSGTDVSNQNYSSSISNSSYCRSKSTSNYCSYSMAFDKDSEQNQQQQEPPQKQRFTPLAMAAHATAMAVLGSDSHTNTNSYFNSSNSPFADDKWGAEDLWQQSAVTSVPAPAPAQLAQTPLDPFPWSGVTNKNIDSSNSHSQSSSNPYYTSLTSSSYSTTNNNNTSFPFVKIPSNTSYDGCFGQDATKPVGIFASKGAFPASSSFVGSFNSEDKNSNSNRNSWSLPMSNGNKSVTSSRSAFNSNSPAIDRYAALKDLDEQLRESKAVAAAAASIVSTSVVESFGGAHNNNNSSSVNPFKNVSTSQQQQPQQNANPFQPNPAINPSAVTAATTATASSGVASLFGSMPTQANATMTNGFAINGIPNQLHHHHQQQQQQAFLNFSNGFASTTAAASHSNGATMFPSGGPNGCGFGYGSVQQQISTSGGGGAAAFNNPFAATGSLNTNNPFL